MSLLNRRDGSGRARGPALYRFSKAVAAPVLGLLFRVRVEGLEQLPHHGPLILAANHLSFMDSVFLSMVSPCPIAFIAKAEYFENRRVAWLFRATGQIPLRRGSGAAAGRTMADAERVLADGGTIGIYPEGTRSRDGRLHRGNTGPARLALASGAPLIAVGLTGTDAVQPPGKLLPHPFRTVTIRFGAPSFLTSDGSSNPRAVLRLATDRLMQAIAGLSGQEYVGAAAATVG